jgi:NAD(P)H-hydrate epimerase
MSNPLAGSMVRPWAVANLACLTGSEAADFDSRAIRNRGVPEAALMERAGAGAAAVIHETDSNRDALVLVGKGNNGGDALVVARCLRAWGWSVEVLLTASRPHPDPLLHGWELPIRSTADMEDTALRSALHGGLERGATVVDGMLGTGIQGAPRGEAARVIQVLEDLRAAQSHSARVVSLDIPSGVDADSGAVHGVAVGADLTVSFGWPKLGSLLHPGRDRAGRQVSLEIGFPPLDGDLARRLLLTPAWAARNRPRRPAVTHKNEVGALAVVAGRTGMAGAAVLAARSALRTGAGFVRVVTPPENREVVQATLPDAVYVDATDLVAVQAALAASRALAVGPGMGTDSASAALLDLVLATPRPRVLDADALNLLAAKDDLQESLAGAPTILTPHPGEASRLLANRGPETEDRLSTVDALRRMTGAVALLKGAPSLVLGDAGLWVDTVGTSDLATAGMGDTLTGAVGAFLAQGCEPQTAAGLALVTTGRAAALAGAGPGLQAADVPDLIPSSLREGPGVTGLSVPGVLLDLDPPR